ncbi:MOSC domain-containing protein [Streptomyces mayteni]
MARVVRLTTYPVKGCAGVPLDRAALTPAGLAHDRAFMVVDAEGRFRSQRRDPGLARIQPTPSADGTRLTLRADGLPALAVTIDTTGPRRLVTLFGSPFHGVDQGQAAADWLSTALGAPSRLVRVPPEHDRVTDGLAPGTSGFADSCAVHLLSLASLDQLNARITARGGRPVPVDRFRANVVVDGWPAPHTEDRSRTLEIGDATLGYAKLAIRCAVTLVDQTTGDRAGPEPLRTLATYRRAAAGGVAFGAKFAVAGPGALAVGDRVRTTERGASELGRAPLPA